MNQNRFVKGIRNDDSYLSTGLKNVKAGQPNSFCLQCLQASCPRTYALPEKFSKIRTPKANNIIQSNLSISNTMAEIAGMIKTRISGIKSL